MNIDFDGDNTLKELQENLQNINLRIIGFQIRGLKRTKKSFIESMLPQELNEPQPFLDLYSKVCDLKDQLDELDIFDKVDLQLDVPPSSVPQTNQDVMIKMNFKEKSLLSVGIAGQVSSDLDDTSLQGDITMINPFGYGEHLSTVYKYDVFTKSILYGLDYTGLTQYGSLNLRLFKDQKNLIKQSSIYQSNSSFLLTLSPLSHSKVYNYLSTANIYFKYDFRDLIPYRIKGMPKFQYKTSLSMLQECRPSTRTALGIHLGYDSLDDPITPTLGLQTHHNLEVSGLLGDCHDFKIESLFSLYLPLSSIYWNSRLSLQISTSYGLIRPLSSYSTIHYIDRFFCDPYKVRGVRAETVGPHADPKEGGKSNGDCLGGMNYIYTNIAISTPLPTEILQALQARFHIFYNLGSIFNGPMKFSEEFKQCFVSSYGFGIYFPLGMLGKLELNYLLNKKAFNMSLRIN